MRLSIAVLAAVFLITFIPTVLVYRAKLWRVNNRVAIAQRDLGRPDEDELETVE